jgi:hypothetical protein
MSKYDRIEELILWGIHWTHTIEPLPNDIHSEMGCLVDVFNNTEIGKIALLYVRPNEIRVYSTSYNILLEKIHNKWLTNEPFIIFNDNKYKQICSEWNNSSNTVCMKDDFE